MSRQSLVSRTLVLLGLAVVLSGIAIAGTGGTLGSSTARKSVVIKQASNQGAVIARSTARRSGRSSMPVKGRAVAARPTTVAGEAGMRIFRDPVTGEIGPPTPESLVPAGSIAPENLSDLREVKLRDGSVMIDLKGHYEESMVMQIDANGKRVMRCVTDPKRALSEVPVQAPSASKREEK